MVPVAISHKVSNWNHRRFALLAKSVASYTKKKICDFDVTCMISMNKLLLLLLSGIAAWVTMLGAIRCPGTMGGPDGGCPAGSYGAGPNQERS